MLRQMETKRATCLLSRSVSSYLWLDCFCCRRECDCVEGRARMKLKAEYLCVSVCVSVNLPCR